MQTAMEAEPFECKNVEKLVYPKNYPYILTETLHVGLGVRGRDYSSLLNPVVDDV